MAGISYKALVQVPLLLQIKKNALSYVCEEANLMQNPGKIKSISRVTRRTSLILFTSHIVHFSIIYREMCHLGAYFTKQCSARIRIFVGNDVFVNTDSAVLVWTPAVVPI